MMWIGLLTVLCGCAENVMLPDDLIGTFTTTNERYVDRSFSMSQTEFAFSNGEETERYTIEEIRLTVEEGRDLYTVTYGIIDREYEFSFYHDKSKNQVIPRHQKNVRWRREDETL